jgi:diguanylate cyclase (GGDEF)-like protein/PAS domain S-box-containing protein
MATTTSSDAAAPNEEPALSPSTVPRGPLEAPPPRRSFHIPSSVFLGAVVLVAVAAIATQVVLSRKAQHDRQAVVNLAQFFVQTNDTRNSQWKAIDGAQNSAPNVASSQATFAAALDALAVRGTDQTPSVRAQLATYVTTIRGILALLQSSQPDQAFSTAVQQEEPQFGVVLNTIAGETTLAANHANHTASIAQGGSIAAMVAATALIGLLFWRFERSQESARALQLEQDALRKSEARFRPLVQNSSDIIMVVEPDHTIRYASPAVERLLGHDVGALVGLKLAELAHTDDAEQTTELLSTTEPQQPARIELRLSCADASHRYVELIGTNLVDDENVRGFVLNGRDVTERKSLEERLRHQAFHDSLTVLPNRARLQERLEQALGRARRTGTSVALLFLDLDDFKTVNDTLGHSAGDEVLVEVAERLRRCLRQQDTAARLGGDEFAILLEDVNHVSDAIIVADRIFEEMKEPFNVDERQLGVRASIGIAMSSVGNEGSVEALLRNADIAMYVAKARGKGRYEIYDQRMHEGILERLALRDELERALTCEELELHYQPIVELDTQKIVSVEALVRWRHPKLGLIAAADFIPVAEETDIIVRLGSWVLREACRQWRTWRDASPGVPPFTLCVNVSVKQIDQAGIVQEIADTLRETAMDAESLVLEITESAPIRDTPRFIARLRELKQLGIKIALDDFGSGHSSFNYLSRLPADILKIDRSFIEALGESDDKESLVRAIVDVGQALGLQIVPEGIEKVGQAAALSRLGCSLGQGYYFSKPVPPDQLWTLLGASSSAKAAA